MTELALCKLRETVDGTHASGVDRFEPTLRQLAAHVEWIRACGGWRNKPVFPPWSSLSSDDKMAFHKTVDESENDRFSRGQYFGPYCGLDIDQILAAEQPARRWSIEHVLPRSKINGRAPGAAENDWFAWDVATRGANARRGNLPLVLWPTPGEPVGVVIYDGERHFNPLEEHKARLARRWTYCRATYALEDALERPSRAQVYNRERIARLCAETAVGYAEERLHLFLIERVKKEFDKTWKNPLNGTIQDRRTFLSDEAFLDLIFQTD